jgi:hypothetical protein
MPRREPPHSIRLPPLPRRLDSMREPSVVRYLEKAEQAVVDQWPEAPEPRVVAMLLVFGSTQHKA